MITVKMSDALMGDICHYHSDMYGYEEGEMDEWFSPECQSFVNKTMKTSRSYRRGRGVFHEVEATQDEVSAVIDEIVKVWITDYDDRADYSFCAEERRQLRAIVRQYKKFVEQYTAEVGE